MYDTLSLLYELVIQKFPYEPRSPTEDSFQACHAFTLGLDLGLSLSRELSQFQEEP